MGAVIEEQGKGGRKKKGGNDDNNDKGGIAIFRGAGRAIQKTLELGLYFMGQEGVKVKVETGTSVAVDDLEVASDVEEGAEDGAQQGEKGSKEEEEKDKIPETRVRRLGYVEVKIWEDG